MAVANPTDELVIKTPRWALPLLKPARYKAAYGGRSGGKSHFLAEYIVERMVCDPDLKVVCIREIQKSLKYSAKTLIENKIRDLGVSHLFDPLTTEIRRVGGAGLCIFQGMQDHTADSIKGLEGFGIAWVEEAQNLSDRSLTLLRPTIRSAGSEILFSWNPEQPTDPVDYFFRSENGPPERSIVVSVNYDQNPFLTPEALEEAAIDRARDPDYFTHVWLGGYNVKSSLQILSGKWEIDEFTPDSSWTDVYHGGDWGFANDPTAAIRAWIKDNRIYVEYESWEIGLELDATAAKWARDIPGIEDFVVRADCARPESINYVKRHGIPRLEAAPKWQGSVEDGIQFLRSFEKIVVHPRCQKFIEECRLYQWKTNSAGDTLPVPLDKYNHCLSPDTLVETINGPIRIDSINPGEMVLTRKGYKRVIDAWISDRNVKTYKVTTSQGACIVGTGNHEVFTQRGFVRIDSLRYNDRVVILCCYLWKSRRLGTPIVSCQADTWQARFITGAELWQRVKRLFTKVLNIIDTQNLKGEQRGFTTSPILNFKKGMNTDCIGGSGLTRMAQYRLGITSTTKTRIPLTTQLKTWSVSPRLNTCLSTQRSITDRIGRSSLNTLKGFALSPWHGIANLKKVGRSTKNWLRLSTKKTVTWCKRIVISAARHSMLTTLLPAQGSALTSASQHGDDLPDLIMFQSHAQSVETNLFQISTQNKSVVVGLVESVTEHKTLPEVWDLMVEDEHEFFANGILVHNCIDSLRYALSPLIKNSSAGYRLSSGSLGMVRKR